MHLLFAAGVVLHAVTWSQSPIAADEHVVLFPTLAHPVEEGSAWAIDVHGWVFEDVPSDASLRAWEDLLDLDERVTDPAERQILRDRLRHWLVDNERGKRMLIRIGRHEFRTDPSGSNGHFHARLVVPAAELPPTQPLGGGARLLTLEAFTAAGDTRRFEGVAYLLPERGLSVISDIDDTIRITEVRDRKAMLQGTFLRPFRPVSDMAAVYTAWQRDLGAQFHYVSASPYQLYAPLAGFLESAGFPRGTLQLKPVRLKDRTLYGLFTAGDRYKCDRLEPLLARFPRRTFVCVGDSSEGDPEAYGQMARTRPGTIRAIFIRDTTGQGPEHARYRRAFRELPREMWRVFADPGEIRDLSSVPGLLQPERTSSSPAAP